MKIYVAHSTGFDFRKELYAPLKALDGDHVLVFPHEEGDEPFSSKEFFRNGCDLVLAEVSYPSTGQGIELGWADVFNVPIVCIFRKGTKPSSALRAISDTLVEYEDTHDLPERVTKLLSEL